MSAGWGDGLEPKRVIDVAASPARRLLKRLVEVVAAPTLPQQRLNRIVALIASNLVAEVCSIYALRADDVLELMATEGLAPEAVHTVRMRVGEGLVGTIAATGDIINTENAQGHPNFVYFPETREDRYRSFLGVPAVRGGRIVGVLTLQNTVPRTYADDDVEALLIIASVLAETLAAGNVLGGRFVVGVPASKEQRRVEGQRLVEGVAIGRVWLHAPKVRITRLLTDNPAQEVERLQTAMNQFRLSLDSMFDRAELGVGEHRDILESYRMVAHDRGWFRRIREAIENGLTAEAAVRRIQDEVQVRLEHASDPYLRERLIDLEDMATRLLMHLVGRDFATEARAMRKGSVLVARNLSAADLVAYERDKLAGIVLEEGSSTAHVTIVARAFGLPLVGRVGRIMVECEGGDKIALDGDNGHAFLNPTEDVIEAFKRVMQARTRRRQELRGLRDLPAVTLDGVPVALSLNAAFLLDVPEVEALGADGIGLYRTELTFMSRPALPDRAVQSEYYRQVRAKVRGRPVLFRTLDIGSDKQLPYWRMPVEENPALGWRALRLTLDRPSLLRTQMRALIEAADGGDLCVMFPMVADVAEFKAARHLLDLELARAEARGLPLPRPLEVGAMMEVPALYWQLPALLREIDFLSIGSNDLFQFLFACDRGSPGLANRYDPLSPPALSLIRDLVGHADAAGVKLSVCGEMASHPLEAMALIGLGVRRLSLSAAQFGDVKAMLRSLDVGACAAYVAALLDLPERSLRRRLFDYAKDHGVVLPNGG